MAEHMASMDSDLGLQWTLHGRKAQKQQCREADAQELRMAEVPATGVRAGLCAARDNNELHKWEGARSSSVT